MEQSTDQATPVAAPIYQPMSTFQPAPASASAPAPAPAWGNLKQATYGHGMSGISAVDYTSFVPQRKGGARHIACPKRANFHWPPTHTYETPTATPVWYQPHGPQDSHITPNFQQKHTMLEPVMADAALRQPQGSTYSSATPQSCGNADWSGQKISGYQTTSDCQMISKDLDITKEAASRSAYCSAIPPACRDLTRDFTRESSPISHLRQRRAELAVESAAAVRLGDAVDGILEEISQVEELEREWHEMCEEAACTEARATVPSLSELSERQRQVISEAVPRMAEGRAQTPKPYGSHLMTDENAMSKTMTREDDDAFGHVQVERSQQTSEVGKTGTAQVEHTQANRSRNCSEPNEGRFQPEQRLDERSQERFDSISMRELSYQREEKRSEFSETSEATPDDNFRRVKSESKTHQDQRHGEQKCSRRQQKITPGEAHQQRNFETDYVTQGQLASESQILTSERRHCTSPVDSLSAEQRMNAQSDERCHQRDYAPGRPIFGSDPTAVDDVTVIDGSAYSAPLDDSNPPGYPGKDRASRQIDAYLLEPTVARDAMLDSRYMETAMLESQGRLQSGEQQQRRRQGHVSEGVGPPTGDEQAPPAAPLKPAMPSTGGGPTVVPSMGGGPTVVPSIGGGPTLGFKGGLPGLGAVGGKGTATGKTNAPRRGRGTMNPAATGSRIPVCATCGNQIRGPFITALGQCWCPGCFLCSTPQCRQSLEFVGFVEVEGKVHCETCWEHSMAPSCKKCNKRIKEDCLKAIGQSYHPECFACAYCGGLFGNSAFFLEDGMPYCENDWKELFTTKCAGCGFPIEAGDRWVEALNKNFHSQCFKCAVCRASLEGQSFFAKQGRAFCKHHARSLQ